MWKLAILVSLAPFALALVLSNLFGLSVFSLKTSLSRTVEQLISHLCLVLGEDNIEVLYVKRPLWTYPQDGTLRISAKHRESRRASHAAIAILALGNVILFRKHQDSIKWRLKMVRLGHILPTFAIFVAAFTFLLAKLPATLAIFIILSSLSISSIMLWISTSVEKETTQFMIGRIEKLRVINRLNEEEDLVAALRATPWVALLPGAILRFIVR